MIANNAAGTSVAITDLYTGETFDEAAIAELSKEADEA